MFLFYKWKNNKSITNCQNKDNKENLTKNNRKIYENWKVDKKKYYSPPVQEMTC